MAEKSTQKKPGFFAKIGAFFKRIVKYFRDTFSEMKKVMWPSKKQIINNTLVVFVVVVVMALIIFLLDTLFGLGLTGLLNLVGK